MKKGYWFCSTLFCVVLGVGLFFDIIYGQDPATGFVILNGIWLRFLLLLMPVGTVLAFSPLAGRVSGRPHQKNNTGTIAISLFVALLILLSGAYALYKGVDEVRYFDAILGGLCFLAGTWLVLFARFLKSGARRPTNSALVGALLCLYFYVLLIARFLAKPASLHRLMPAISLLSGLCMVCFILMLLKGSYLKSDEVKGSGLYLWGQLCFLFSFCLTIPKPLYTLLILKTGFDLSMVAYVPELAMGILGLVMSYNSVTKAKKGTLLNL